MIVQPDKAGGLKEAWLPQYQIDARGYTTSCRAMRINAAMDRRLAMLRAFLLPFGAPGDSSPCIRQRPFFIAGDWHWLPRRVRARHRGAWCMGKCVGLFL